MINPALVAKEGMYGDQGGVLLIRSGEISICNLLLCAYEQVWTLESIVSQELRWRQHGNGTVDPDLSSGVGEESIGRRREMEQRCG